jgi:transglutaminase-like putative cysteine protease
MVILFVLFPRVAPLWGLPSDAMTGRSGLSANMQIGNIANLALDGSVAMRIHFDDTIPPQSEMYFRGPVLAGFDGRQWRPPSPGAVGSSAPSPPELQTLGEPVRYEVTLESTQRPWIMVLDATPIAPELKGYAPRIGADLQWVADRPLTELVRYRAQSYTHFRYGPQRMGPALLEYLDLPPGYNPRTREFAARMRKDPLYAKADSATLVAAVLERLRSGGYTYTLSPGLFGNDSADEFWFDRKQGFCEHIASAFVVLMRALGVPARIVTGYQGGQANAVDGYWTVRQSDAHAWAEIWVASQGWVRVDPTAAIAPGRTGGTQRLEAPSGIFNRALITINPRFAFDLRNLWEAANNRWNQWILNYSQERQFDLLRNLGFASPDWEDVGYVLIGIVVLASLLGALWTLWEKHQHDPWLRLLHDAQRRLARAGLLLAGNSSARQTALKLRERAAAADPAIDEIGRWLLRLETWRYAKNSPLTLGTLREEFRRLHWPRQLP